MADVIVARTRGEVEPALRKLGEARSSGLYAPGYFSYELGYALELKLARLMPARRALPLIWFGLFRTRKELDGAELDALIAAMSRGRAYMQDLSASRKHGNVTGCLSGEPDLSGDFLIHGRSARALRTVAQERAGRARRLCRRRRARDSELLAGAVLPSRR